MTGVTPGTDATKWKLFIDNSAAAAATTAANTAANAANTAATNATNATGYIADPYDATKTYAVGDYVIYNGKLYRCNTTISTAEAWTAMHWTETQVGDDVGELKSAFLNKEPINWFDKTTAINGKNFNYYGDLSTNGIMFAAYVPVSAGKYTFQVSYIDLGGNATRIHLYDANKGYLSSVNGTVIGGSTNYPIITIEIANESAKFIGISYRLNEINNFMVVKGETYPEIYSEYFDPFSELHNVTVRPEDVIGLTDTCKIVNNLHETVNDILVSYLNIFNRANINTPGYLNGGNIVGTSGVTYDYIEITHYGEYISNCVAKTLYGNAYNNCVAFYNAEKTYLRNAAITIISDNGNNSVGTFKIENDVKYIRVTIYSTNVANTAMIVFGTTLPDYYIDNGETNVSTVDFIESIKGNVLFGKTAIFDGDSICASSTDVSGNGAYAGRISVANAMIIHNYAVGGGTITSETYSGSTPKHWIVDSIDSVYNAHPDADYIILEGGTNDADVIGSIINGNTPERFGSYSMTDFSGDYDDETFCGAVELLIYKAINYWPSKKIGFVIAMKMGKTSNGYTPETNNRRAYFETIMDICDKWGIPYLNLWDNCYMNPSLDVCYDSTMRPQENVAANKMYQDGQHPAPRGYDYIAPIIGEWMKTL